MRRVTLVATLLLALLAGRAHAQATAGANAGFAVTVVDGLSVTAAQDLEFGDVVAGAGLVTKTNTDANIGKFQIVGQHNRRVLVTLNAPAALTNGASSIAYTPAAGFHDRRDDAANLAGTFAFTAGTATRQFRLRDASPPGALSQAFVYIYGSLNVGAVPAGAYSATFTLSAVYF